MLIFFSIIISSRDSDEYELRTRIIVYNVNRLISPEILPPNRKIVVAFLMREKKVKEYSEYNNQHENNNPNTNP